MRRKEPNARPCDKAPGPDPCCAARLGRIPPARTAARRRNSFTDSTAAQQARGRMGLASASCNMSCRMFNVRPALAWHGLGSACTAAGSGWELDGQVLGPSAALALHHPHPSVHVSAARPSTLAQTRFGTAPTPCYRHSIIAGAVWRTNKSPHFSHTCHPCLHLENDQPHAHQRYGHIDSIASESIARPAYAASCGGRR